MIQNAPVVKRVIYVQTRTTNKSFIDMHLFLKNTMKINNNQFFLALFDPSIDGVNPRDKRIFGNQIMMQKILRECITNYWYFLREAIRIPEQGGAVGDGTPFQLHRGNLALNYCLQLNLNVFEELPRQQGKTIAVICRMLWIFIYGTRNSEIAFLNKKHEDSKLNLSRLKDIRDTLPQYLRGETQATDANGKKIKSKNSTETIENKATNNKIKTFPAAPTVGKANQLGRGCTQPIQWYDEYAFIVNNTAIYLSATPAFSRASLNAQKNGAPYGIIITTTPGILTTPEGKDAFQIKEYATKFSERWYDQTVDEINNTVKANTDNSFVYIRFTYKELGKSDAWFAKLCVDMKKDWDAIRREVLLEWAEVSGNSPFNEEDLNIIKAKIRQPIGQYVSPVGLNNVFDVYEKLLPNVVYIMGVDVSGGLNRDFSAITVINSNTTDIVMTYNSNRISPIELSKLIYDVVKHAPGRFVINIERNGGFGASTIAGLLKTDIKPSLYYEVKDCVLEERMGDSSIKKFKKMKKVYGFNETNQARNGLFALLNRRVEYHKDKFGPQIIYDELRTLEVKSSGRWEHTSNGHDDQLFSYMLALHVWYEGTNLMQRYGIKKVNISTDDENTEDVTEIDGMGYGDLDEDIITGFYEDDDPNSARNQIEAIKDNTQTQAQFQMREYQKDQAALKKIMQNKLAREAYSNKYSATQDDISIEYGDLNENGYVDLPMDIFLDNDRDAM